MCLVSDAVLLTQPNDEKKMTNTTQKSIKATIAAQAVAKSGYLFAAHKAEAIATLKHAVEVEKRDAKAMRTDFIGGYIAYALWPTENVAKAIAKGKGIVGAAGAGREAKAGQAVRTDAEETAYAAGRQAWSRMAREAGVIADTRGGARTAKKAAKKVAKPAKGKVLENPKVSSAVAAHAHLLNMAKMASGFVAKNREQVSPEASTAVADFVAKMAAIAK